jgi:hypothetical protein
MAILYRVYLAKKSTTPDNWDTDDDADYDDADGWVKFICSNVVDKVVQKNKVIHTSSHTKIRIVTGKFIQSITLMDCVIVNTGNTESSEYYNAVKEFLLRHMALGTATEYKYPLYLHIYTSATVGIKWMDASEAMQPYLVVGVKSFSFKLDHAGVYRGTIQLEEA